MKSPGKESLREAIKAQLSALDPSWIRQASAALCRNLSTLLAKSAGVNIKYVLAWKNFFPGEVDLGDFIDFALRERRVFLPRINEHFSIQFAALGPDWVGSLEAGPRGIPQPAASMMEIYDVSCASETMVLVPGLAFDLRGARLGRGGGCYDRFLAQSAMQTQAWKVGVCFRRQIVDCVKTQRHDIPVSLICTEDGVVETDS